MVNQQHQQSIRAANEKGRQHCQWEVGDSVMSWDYWGDLKWRSGLIVNKAGPLMYEVQVAPGIIWRWDIHQLKPTAVEPTVEVSDTDTVEVSQPKVASTPPAPIQLSAPPNVVGTVPEIPMADQPEMVPVPTPIAPDPPEATPVSPTVHERRYPQRVHRAPQRLNLWTIFLFFLETVGYWTLSVDLVVSLRLCLRLSYNLGMDHFSVVDLLWCPCVLTIYSNRNVFVVNRHVVRVCSPNSRRYVTLVTQFCLLWLFSSSVKNYANWKRVTCVVEFAVGIVVVVVVNLHYASYFFCHVSN